MADRNERPHQAYIAMGNFLEASVMGIADLKPGRAPVGA
jgi:hypothetical protein